MGSFAAMYLTKLTPSDETYSRHRLMKSRKFASFVLMAWNRSLEPGRRFLPLEFVIHLGCPLESTKVEHFGLAETTKFFFFSEFLKVFLKNCSRETFNIPTKEYPPPRRLFQHTGRWHVQDLHYTRQLLRFVLTCRKQTWN